MANSLVLGEGYITRSWRMLDYGLPTGEMESKTIISGTAESDLHIVTRSYYNHTGFDGYLYVSIHVNDRRIADSYVARNYPNWGGDWKSFVPRGSCSAICPKDQKYKITVEFCSTLPDSNPNNESPLVEYHIMGIGCTSSRVLPWWGIFRRTH